MGVQNGFANVIVWNGGALFTVLSVFIVILFSEVLLRKKKGGRASEKQTNSFLPSKRVGFVVDGISGPGSSLMLL